MTFCKPKHREKLFSAHSAESNFSFSETKFCDKYSRWMSTDPKAAEYMDGKDANSTSGGIYSLANFNLYHYGANNPIKYCDPTGLDDDLPKTATPEQKKAAQEMGADFGKFVSELSDSAAGSPAGQVVGAVCDFVEQYQTMLEENVIGNDSYNHAMANSKATQRGEWGKKTAQSLSFLREATDVLRKGDTEKDIREDNVANRHGRDIKPGEKPEEHNAVFDTRRGGHRVDLKDKAPEKTPQNPKEFMEAFSKHDEYE